MKLRIKEKDGMFYLQEKACLFWHYCEPSTEWRGFNRWYDAGLMLDACPSVPTLDEAVAWANRWREAYDVHKKKVIYYRV